MSAESVVAWSPRVRKVDETARKALSSRRSMLLAAAVPFGLVAALTFANTSDDPLITLRYAANLLHHGQPVFNLGEHVEGYSSPLHLLIATIVLLTPGGLALFKLKLVSMAFAVATLVQTTRLSRAARLPAWAQLSVVVAVAGSWNFVVSASNGLETSLVAFLATGAAASLAQPDARKRWWIPAIWAGLLAVSRPDADLVIVLLALVSLAIERRDRWWRRVAWLIGPAVAGGALVAFRLAYYHELVPNTFYAKHLAPLDAVRRGLAYLVTSQPLGLVLSPIVVGLGSWLISLGLRRFVNSRPALLYAVAILAAQILFILESGGDWMKGGRFLVPAIPAATVLVFCGLEARLESKRQRGWNYRRLRNATIATVAVLVSPVSPTSVAPVWRLSGIGDEALIAHGNYAGYSPIWIEAVGLGSCLRPGQLVAYSEGGLFGYEHQDLRVLDLRGLTSPAIARGAPASDKYPWGVQDARWFLASSPVGQVLVKSRPQMIISFDDSVDGRPWILDGLYRRSLVVPELADNNTLYVYLRRGFACTSLGRGPNHLS